MLVCMRGRGKRVKPGGTAGVNFQELLSQQKPYFCRDGAPFLVEAFDPAGQNGRVT